MNSAAVTAAAAAVTATTPMRAASGNIKRTTSDMSNNASNNTIANTLSNIKASIAANEAIAAGEASANNSIPSAAIHAEGKGGSAEKGEIRDRVRKLGVDVTFGGALVGNTGTPIASPSVPNSARPDSNGSSAYGSTVYGYGSEMDQTAVVIDNIELEFGDLDLMDRESQEFPGMSADDLHVYDSESFNNGDDATESTRSRLNSSEHDLFHARRTPVHMPAETLHAFSLDTPGDKKTNNNEDASPESEENDHFPGISAEDIHSDSSSVGSNDTYMTADEVTADPKATRTEDALSALPSTNPSPYTTSAGASGPNTAASNAPNESSAEKARKQQAISFLEEASPVADTSSAFFDSNLTQDMIGEGQKEKTDSASTVETVGEVTKTPIHISIKTVSTGATEGSILATQGSIGNDSTVASSDSTETDANSNAPQSNSSTGNPTTNSNTPGSAIKSNRYSQRPATIKYGSDRQSWGKFITDSMWSSAKLDAIGIAGLNGDSTSDLSTSISGKYLDDIANHVAMQSEKLLFEELLNMAVHSIASEVPMNGDEAGNSSVSTKESTKTTDTIVPMPTENQILAGKRYRLSKRDSSRTPFEEERTWFAAVDEGKLIDDSDVSIRNRAGTDTMSVAMAVLHQKQLDVQLEKEVCIEPILPVFDPLEGYKARCKKIRANSGVADVSGCITSPRDGGDTGMKETDVLNTAQYQHWWPWLYEVLVFQWGAIMTISLSSVKLISGSNTQSMVNLYPFEKELREQSIQKNIKADSVRSLLDEHCPILLKMIYKSLALRIFRENLRPPVVLDVQFMGALENLVMLLAVEAASFSSGESLFIFNFLLFGL